MSNVADERKKAPQAVYKMKPYSNASDGTVVSVTANSLKTTNEQGMAHSYILADDATITRDGVNCKAEDLRAGSKTRVTTKRFDRGIAIHVESIDENADFE